MLALVTPSHPFDGCFVFAFNRRLITCQTLHNFRALCKPLRIPQPISQLSYWQIAIPICQLPALKVKKNLKKMKQNKHKSLLTAKRTVSDARLGLVFGLEFGFGFVRLCLVRLAQLGPARPNLAQAQPKKSCI